VREVSANEVESRDWFLVFGLNVLLDLKRGLDRGLLLCPCCKVKVASNSDGSNSNSNERQSVFRTGHYKLIKSSVNELNFNEI
jgi:hypothetical protein